MPKSVLTVDLQRPSSNVPWGFLICGGRDQASDNLGLVPSLDVLFQGLTLKIGNVKKLTPASRAGLCKMDYLISVGISISVRGLAHIISSPTPSRSTRSRCSTWPTLRSAGRSRCPARLSGLRLKGLRRNLQMEARARVDMFLGEITLFPASKNCFLDWRKMTDWTGPVGRNTLAQITIR